MGLTVYGARMETIKQIISDIRDFEEHQMPWPLMVLASFILLMMVAQASS